MCFFLTTDPAWPPTTEISPTHLPRELEIKKAVINQHRFAITNPSYYIHSSYYIMTDVFGVPLTFFVPGHNWMKSILKEGNLTRTLFDWSNTKAVTYDERPKMKRDAREKDCFQSGISLHFRMFVVRYFFRVQTEKGCLTSFFSWIKLCFSKYTWLAAYISNSTSKLTWNECRNILLSYIFVVDSRFQCHQNFLT